ncbi:uncharacterized protein LOC131854046 [Achroia grisella]|uniref:uncharacterized protein LOC131854046 n=1 Tax=Achroia grisella TaxID=688607 RepID=UPI0027D300CA|nr:uncharacterized protein LOC131854046 [Achroia grisella]
MEQDDSVAELDAPSMELDTIRDGDVPSLHPRSPQTRTILFLLATSVPRRPRAPSQPKQSVPMTAPLNRPRSECTQVAPRDQSPAPRHHPGQNCLEHHSILEDLQSQNYPAHEVHRMYQSRSRNKAAIDLVLVVLDLSPEGKSIFDIKSVCQLSSLSVEAPRKRTYPGQCHRCQNYGTLPIAAVGPTPPRPPVAPSASQRVTPRITAVVHAPHVPPKRRPPTHRATVLRHVPPPRLQTQPEPLVPAPLPANNAWIKPPAIVSKVAPNPPAQKAPPAQSPPPVQSAPPMPIHKPVPKPLPAAPKANGSSLAQDFALVARLASTIDPNEIALLASKLRLYKESPQNRLAAVCEHIGVLTAILNFNL